ncbi:hypothetical protein CAPTEDRAFT_194437 [Capitella teleta]|uniref:EF-hand domain-containing protein n=1 Tax=Capitella teleta TaxID=283909 RepID=R7UKN6_CAPTE|nr:hypothetical protein CAPTEDRAFT_194437 [Capitella teleta]|eukprot:ELU06795.1 hypothetical protein CAPTEDRAFT_194437 [Capitella teleta]
MVPERELWQLFQRYASSTGVLIQPQIRRALNSIELYPTKSQVFEMVHCSCECSGRTPVDHLTFGEFCILTTELSEAYRKNAPAPIPKSQLKDKAALVLEERRKKRKPSGPMFSSHREMRSAIEKH